MFRISLKGPTIAAGTARQAVCDVELDLIAANQKKVLLSGRFFPDTCGHVADDEQCSRVACGERLARCARKLV